MRNRLIHGYYDINKNIVWKTIKEDIPPLSADLENILEYEQQLKEAILKNNLYKELSLYGLDGDLILYYQVKQDINKVGRYKIFITEIATPTS